MLSNVIKIPLGPQPGVQVLKILLQVLPILVLGDPIHPDCRILSDTPVGGRQRRHIQGDAPVNGTVARVPFALGPLPFEFLVT